MCNYIKKEILRNKMPFMKGCDLRRNVWVGMTILCFLFWFVLIELISWMVF